MKARGGGVILMIASIWGRESGGRMTYNAVKAAEISLAKAMAQQLAPMNIRVNSIAPGSILFPGGSWHKRQQADPQGIAEFIKRDLPFGRFGRADEVGNVVAFLASAARAGSAAPRSRSTVVKVGRISSRDTCYVRMCYVLGAYVRCAVCGAMCYVRCGVLCAVRTCDVRRAVRRPTCVARSYVRGDVLRAGRRARCRAECSLPGRTAACRATRCARTS